MKALQKDLDHLFGRSKRTTTEKRHSVSAKLKAEASAAGCKIEALSGGGFNVWPPAGVANDPFDGDHYAATTTEAREMLKAYAPASAQDHAARKA